MRETPNYALPDFVEYDKDSDSVRIKGREPTSIRAIWKYPIPYSPTPLAVPKGAIFRHMGIQAGSLTLWLEVDAKTTELEHVIVEVFGTGQHINERAEYLGTYTDGPFVWHAHLTRLRESNTPPREAPTA